MPDESKHIAFNSFEASVTELKLNRNGAVYAIILSIDVILHYSSLAGISNIKGIISVRFLNIRINELPIASMAS